MKTSLNYAEVPLRMEDDINKNYTTWADGKCVKFEDELYVTYYAMHKTEDRVEETPDGKSETKTVCLAVPVAIRKGRGSEELHALCPSDEVYKEILPLFEADNVGLMRAELIGRIREYDKSVSVNSFILDGKSVWLDKDTRVGLMNSTKIQQAAGVLYTVLWFDGVSYTIPCESAIQMLSDLELYALECYNVTAKHESNARKLVNGFEDYDYTALYPQRPNFSTK